MNGYKKEIKATRKAYDDIRDMCTEVKHLVNSVDYYESLDPKCSMDNEVT